MNFRHKADNQGIHMICRVNQLLNDLINTHKIVDKF